MVKLSVNSSIYNRWSPHTKFKMAQHIQPQSQKNIGTSCCNLITEMQWFATPLEPQCKYSTKKLHLMSHLINYTVFYNYTLTLNLMPATYVEKLGQENVCHCATSHLCLINSNCWSFDSVILALYMTSVAQQFKISVTVFRASYKFGLQVDQPGTHTPLLWSHAVVKNMA